MQGCCILEQLIDFYPVPAAMQLCMMLIDPGASLCLCAVAPRLNLRDLLQADRASLFTRKKSATLS